MGEEALGERDMNSQGIGLGILALPFVIGGFWASSNAGINDFIHGLAFVLTLVVGPASLCTALMSKRGRWIMFEGESDKPFLVYVGVVFAFAYLLFCRIDGRPVDIQRVAFDSSFGRYMGCVIYSWALMPFGLLFLDRVCGVFEPNGKALDQLGWLDRKVIELFTKKESPVAPAPEAKHPPVQERLVDDPEIAFDPRRFGLPLKEEGKGEGPWSAEYQPPRSSRS